MLDATQAAVVSRAALFSPETFPTPQSPTAIVKPSTFIWDLDFGETAEPAIDEGRSSKKAKTKPHHDDSKLASKALKGEEEEPEQEFEFPLFTTLSSKTQTIALPRTPSPVPLGNPEPTPAYHIFTEDEIAGAYALHRPFDYYLASHQPERELQQAAIEAQDVIRLGQARWKGCEVPWRVTSLKITTEKSTQKRDSKKTRSTVIVTAVNPALLGSEIKTQRRRPNKKRRIILRKRVKDMPAQRQKTPAGLSKNKSKKTAPTKKTEEEEREKKTRLNRLKKVRRKLKIQGESKPDGVAS